ncbi:MAG: citrate lyase holo-[acyl-carrier protein] synthase [Clostridia bacterium]
MDFSKAISLEDILIARDERSKKQKEIVDLYGVCVISFTVNIPGEYKDILMSRKIHYEGRNVLARLLRQKNISIVHEEVYYKATGAEAFIAVDTDETLLKEVLVTLENNHPLGRLFDFDVIGKGYKIITRADINQKNRRCLLCEEDAAACTRSRRHSYDKLMEEIYNITRRYFEEDEYKPYREKISS